VPYPDRDQDFDGFDLGLLPGVVMVCQAHDNGFFEAPPTTQGTSQLRNKGLRAGRQSVQEGDGQVRRLDTVDTGHILMSNANPLKA
jgi:hypothetical protein